MTTELQIKVERAIRLLQSASPQDGSPVEVAYSGGKDSDVILELTKMAGINYRAIYKNTTIDPPGTIKHCRDNSVSSPTAAHPTSGRDESRQPSSVSAAGCAPTRCTTERRYGGSWR